MALAASDPRALRLRSVTPGRARWELDALVDRERQAHELELRLRQYAEVQDVTASALTGRILILFDPATHAGVIERLLESVLALVIGDEPVAPERSRFHLPPVTAGETALLTGGLILLTPIVFGAPFLFPAVVGATALAGAAAIKRSIERRQVLEAVDPEAEARRARHPAMRLLSYAKPHRRMIVAASVCSVVKKVFDLSPPILIGLALDLVVNQRSTFLAALGIGSVTTQLYVLGGLTILAFTLESVFEFGYKLLWRNLAQTIQHEMRRDAYDHVQRLQLSHLEDERTGSVAIAINENINQLELFVNDDVNSLLEIATNTVVVVTLFAFVMPGVGLFALAPIPILLWASMKYQRNVGPIYADIEAQNAELTSEVVTNLTGITVIRSYTAEEHESARIARASTDYLNSSRRANLFFSAFDPTMRLPVLVGFTIVLVAGGIMAINGSLTVGMYALMLFLIQRFLFPFGYLGQTVNRYQKTMKAIDRVFTVLDLEEEHPGGGRRLAREEVRGEIVFDHVSFEYEPGAPVLRDFHLRIPPGQRLGIVGATGAGKTSLIKLLLRFYDVTAGRILLDGSDIREFAVRDLRRVIGMVGQEAMLFDETIAENIAYGNFAAPFGEIATAARAAEADAFIGRLPAGYDTLVGEMGVKLSGGERQRISIARAILKDPPILVLDEATSAVDNETEAAIQRSLDRVSVGRTTVVIAHRLSTVRNVDRIVVMERGVITEEGRHDELIRRGGFYARLWHMQTGNGERTA